MSIRINLLKNSIRNVYYATLSDLSFQIESMIKDDAKIKEQEKQRLNQFLQQLDLKDRRMTEILRTGETLIVQINQLKSEIEKIPINT